LLKKFGKHLQALENDVNSAEKGLKKGWQTKPWGHKVALF